MPTCHACHGGRCVASTGKRLGEDRTFTGAFVVFCRIYAIFRLICLGGNGIFRIFANDKGCSAIGRSVGKYLISKLMRAPQCHGDINGN